MGLSTPSTPLSVVSRPAQAIGRLMSGVILSWSPSLFHFCSFPQLLPRQSSDSEPAPFPSPVPRLLDVTVVHNRRV